MKMDKTFWTYSMVGSNKAFLRIKTNFNLKYGICMNRLFTDKLSSGGTGVREEQGGPEPRHPHTSVGTNRALTLT